MTNRNSITEAWVVKIWLYISSWKGCDSGSASCTRTRRAARPPNRKKMKVETMYISPIFLWSVVVSQAPMPRRRTACVAGSDAGRVGRATRGGAAAVAMRSDHSCSSKHLLQRFEIRDDVRRFLVGEAEVRHERARLEGGWIHDPRLQVVRAPVW